MNELKHSFLLIILLSATAMFGQRGLTSSNKKALKAYEQGLDCMRFEDRKCAELNMLKALEHDADFVEPYIILGEIYEEQDRVNEAIAQFEEVVKRNARIFTNAYYRLGKLRFSKGEYEEAEKMYREFVKKTSDQNRLRGLAFVGIESCEFAAQAKETPVPFEPVNLGKNVNTDKPEYYPCITADGKTLMYTRLEPKVSSKGKQEDFFVSRLKDENWSPGWLVKGVSTTANEGAGTLSADGRFLIYTACDQNGSGDFGAGRKGYGSCDLFISIKVGDRWSKAQNLGNKINSSNWESQPSLSSDGRTLYFIKGGFRQDGSRAQDIFMSRLGDDGEWSKAERLNKNVNSPYLEESVQIHPDGQTLYFTSNGHPGMGGLDIFMSKKQEDGSWGKAVNVGYPINTAGDENSVLISSDGQMAYFASDREGGFGDLDLYGFKTHEAMRPDPVTYLKGKAFDKETGKGLEAEVILFDIKTGERVTGSYSDPTTGEFLVCVPAGRDYALNSSADGYLFFSENYSFGLVKEFEKPIDLEIPMSPIKGGATLELRNVFFETASAELKDASKLELDRVARLLAAESTMNFEIAGHTDNVGDAKANLALSEMRARSVRDYLIKKGIDASRSEAKGYGETMPINSNDSEEGRARNRRTEIKIK